MNLLPMFTILVGVIIIGFILWKNDKYALIQVLTVGVLFALVAMLAWLVTADFSIFM